MVKIVSSRRAVSRSPSPQRICERVTRLQLTSSVLLGLAAVWSTFAAAQPTLWAEGRILVQPRAGLSESKLQEIVGRHNGRAKGRIQNLGVHIVEVPPQAEQAIVRALGKNRHIDFAERDMLLEVSEVSPNDPNYSSQWHLPKIQASTAWSTTQGSGIKIAILDTGVDPTHPDLSGKLLPGWNAVDGSTSTHDLNGHGTAVAGSAAATTNNATGVAGVAGASALIPIRVSNRSDGYAYFSDIARGLTWAADNGAKVANISYDATSSSSISSAAQYMRSKGGMVVVAAGNSGGDPGYSDNPYMISVSASTSSDTKASWSSYGYYVDVVAPGASIYTTKNGGSYGSWNGTSFSSPVTAGVVGLIMAANPNLSPVEIEEILENTADDLGAAGWDTYYGYGRVNAAAAVEAAAQFVAADTQAPSVSITSPSGGATVSGLVPVDVSASDNVGLSRVELFADGVLVASDTTEPFAFSWDTTSVADGSKTLVAYAYDAAGNQGVSSAKIVTVDNVADPIDETAPTVQITSPSDGANVQRTVTIKASAADNVGVTQLSLYVDGKLLCSTSNATASCGWNTRKASSGAHTITASAKDAAGNTTDTTISVTVGGGGSSGGGKGNGGGKKK